jgi:hypothetical protein
LKKDIKICASFSDTPQTIKVTTIVSDKHLVMMQNASKLWVEDINRKKCSEWQQRVIPKSIEHMWKCQQGFSETRNYKPFSARNR